MWYTKPLFDGLHHSGLHLVCPIGNHLTVFLKILKFLDFTLANLDFPDNRKTSMVQQTSQCTDTVNHLMPPLMYKPVYNNRDCIASGFAREFFMNFRIVVTETPVYIFPRFPVFWGFQQFLEEIHCRHGQTQDAAWTENTIDLVEHILSSLIREMLKKMF